MRAAALQLQRQVHSPFYDARQQFAGTNKSLRVIYDFLCSPTAAVFESALLMPAIVFVILYACLELFSGVFGTNQGVAHFAHLGGMIGAYLTLRHWRRRERGAY